MESYTESQIRDVLSDFSDSFQEKIRDKLEAYSS